MAARAFVPPLDQRIHCDRIVKGKIFFSHQYKNIVNSRPAMAAACAMKRRENRLVLQLSPTYSPRCTDSVRTRSQKQRSNASSSALVHHILSWINDATKWIVSGGVLLILLLKRDEVTCWCVVGGIVAAFTCRALKFAINASRPPQAKKKDPGMPSSHACSLGYLSVFASLVMLDVSMPTSAAVSLPILGLFLTYLRVLLGYHTFAQVAVGWVLGSTIAVAWHGAGNLLLSHITANSAGKGGLALVTVLFLGMFALKNVMRWRHE
eukprot:jgi/Picsp_1/2282/NSC_05746-R1_protein